MSCPVSLLRILALALVICLFNASPARAEYCETIDWGDPRFPDGDCRRIHVADMGFAEGGSRIVLLAENEVAVRLGASAQRELIAMVDEVAAGVRPAIAALRGIALPPNIYVVVVNDSGADGARAETVRRRDGASDCPVVLYSSAVALRGVLARTLAHEIFHCAQYRTWPDKTGGAEARWWMEGSAEWFEDFALPARVGDSDLMEALRVFRARSPDHSLLEGTYANVVFFAWLGKERMVSFLGAMAGLGETQLAGAARAMTDAEYQSFAQAYVDERVVTPSGLTVAGAEFGPQMPSLHTTTGRPGADPPWQMERVVPPLTLSRGIIHFVPARYAPSGQFGAKRNVFSLTRGSWGALPNPLISDCGGRKEVRFAAMSLVEGRLRVDPGTAAAASTDCACPVGVWTIGESDLQSLSPTPDMRLVSRGEVSMTFNRDGTGAFLASRLRFEGPERRQGPVRARIAIERTYRASFTWHAEGNLITMNQTVPLRIVEQTYHYVSGLPGGGVSGPSRRPRVSDL
jgi:hypothetical protein